MCHGFTVEEIRDMTLPQVRAVVRGLAYENWQQAQLVRGLSEVMLALFGAGAK